MALKGNLKDFNVTQILNLINQSRKTGVLNLSSSAAAAAKLYFREGMLIDASLEGQNAELAALLFRIGKISAEQQASVQTHASVSTDKETALLLINSGFATQANIVQAVRSHLLDTVYQLFTWDDGTFSFEPGASPSEDRITVPIPLEGVIMEGTRRVQEWESLQDELPDLDMAMRFVEHPSGNLKDINLSVDEWRVISFIHPRNSIKQIAEYNKMNEFQIRKIVYRMIAAGLVELVQPEGVTPKQLINRPAATTGPAAAGRRPAQVQAPAGLPAGAATATPTETPNQGSISRLIDRIKQL